MPPSTHRKALKLLGTLGPRKSLGHLHGPYGTGKSGGSVASTRERHQL
jgi:hypothetical protein